MRVLRHIFIIILLVANQSACSLLFLTEAGESLSHFDASAPAESAPAPDFELFDIDGNKVPLHELVGKKPVVVQLGSYSCPVFRYRRFDMQKLQREFDGRVNFIVVYTLEAHPVDTINPYEDRIWNPLINKMAGVNLPAHKSAEERRAQALVAYDVMGLDSKFLLDGMDNSVWQQYGAAPSAAYVLDLLGNIRLRQAWVYPKEIRKTLIEILQQ